MDYKIISKPPCMSVWMFENGAHGKHKSYTIIGFIHKRHRDSVTHINYWPKFSCAVCSVFEARYNNNMLGLDFGEDANTNI